MSVENLESYQNPFENALAAMDQLAAAGSPVIVDYPPTQRVQFGRAYGDISPSYRAVGAELTDPEQRQTALSALPNAMTAQRQGQVIITGRRQEANGASSPVTVVLSPNFDDHPDTRTTGIRFVIVGESREAIRRGEPTLDEEGATLAVNGSSVRVDGFYLLPNVDSHSRQQASRFAASSLGRWIRAQTGKPAPKRVAMPQATIPR